MGVDAVIFVRTTDGQPPALDFGTLSGGATLQGVKPRDNDSELWADYIEDRCGVRPTHKVENSWRYYGPGYERGPWPEIAATLLYLMAAPNVDGVWYDGDSADSPEAFDVSRLDEINDHWLRHGTRPYYQPRDFDR